MELDELKFGGLPHRYREKKGRLVRSIDPFSRSVVMFSTTLGLDNWLIRLFTPGTVNCYAGPICALVEGRYMHVAADLVTEFKDGLRVADLVANSAHKVNSKWDSLKQAAYANGMQPVLRTTKDIRGNPVLLCNLEMMRQHLVAYRHQSFPASRVSHSVVTVLANSGREHLRRETLDEMFAKTPEQLATLHSALFWLYRNNTIFIDIAEVPYGLDSKIAVC